MPTGILTFAPIRRISLLAPLLSVSPFSGCGRPKRRGRHEQRRSFHRGSQAPAKRFAVRGDRLCLSGAPLRPVPVSGGGCNRRHSVLLVRHPPRIAVGFGTDRLRCEEAMETASRENPERWVATPSNRAPGAEGQNRSCSNRWAARQEKIQPLQLCFFLTSPFRELTRSCQN